MEGLRKGLFVAATVLLTCGFAFANGFRASGSTLIVNGVPVLKLRGPRSAERVRDLAAILANLPEGRTVSARRIGKSFVLSYGSSPILTIGTSESAAQGLSPAFLASRWTASLRSALALPALKLGSEALKLGSGSKATVSLTGSRADAAVIQSSDDQVAAIRRTDGGFEVKTGSFGDATITVSAGEIIRTVMVKVMPYAARFPQTLLCEVTGAPATVDTVRGAIHGTLTTGLTARPLAAWKCKRFKSRSVAPGGSAVVNVHVVANAPDCLPCNGAVQVIVRNVALSHRAETQLWYSNSPESVKRPQNLFSATLKVGSPARLLYHHVNDSPTPLATIIQAVNLSDRDARVVVIAGDAKPDRSPVLAGYLAAEQFVPSWMCGSGEVVTIPPHSTLPISMRRLAPGVTSSGLCSIELLDGGPTSLAVRVDARYPVQHDERYAEALMSSTPWHEVGCRSIQEADILPTAQSELVFPHPFMDEEAEYKVGGRYGFVRIGQSPIAREDHGEGLQGNYGVLYTIKVHIENPTNVAADVELVYESSAGYSSVVMVIDGETKRIPLVKPGGEARVMKFHLEPGRSRMVNVMTFPLSGGSYPATLVLRPIVGAS